MILIHDGCCDAPLLDRGKLEGAVASPFVTWGGADLYPTLVAKAAKLIESISRAHAFLDGNKRTAWLSFVTMLEINGLDVRHLQAITVADAVEQIAIRVHDIQEITLWANGLIAD